MTETLRFGRIISTAGIRQDGYKLNGLTNMECSSTGVQFQIFFCVIQWLHSAITNFQVLTKGIDELLERVYAKYGKRKKRAVTHLSLSAVGMDVKNIKTF